MGRCLSVVVVLVLVLGLGMPAAAREVIERFDVSIVVQPDGAIEVTETIRITVEGVDVRRGIERQIPLDRADGGRASFELLAVRRGAVEEPVAQIRDRQGVLLRIGRPDLLLPVPSVQTYTIRYRSRGQLRGFAGFDELYWNVTGNELPFTIAAASVVVLLPGGLEMLQDAAYTGRRGARGTSFRVVERGPVRYAAETTAALPPGHGFTVAVGWPKGAIAGVDEVPQRPRVLGLPALLVTLPAALVLSLLLAFGLRVGCCGGPSAAVVYPRFRPPEGLSPAACRYLDTGRIDDRSLTACIVGLASKGALKIVDGRARPRFTLVPTGAGSGLHPDEATVRDSLFEGHGQGEGEGEVEPVVLGGYEDRVPDARRALGRVIERAHRNTDFRGFEAVFGLGFMAMILIVAAAVVAPYRAMPELAMGCLGILAVTTLVAAIVVWWLRREVRPVATRPPRGLLWDNLEIVGLLLVLGITTGLVGLALAVDHGRHGAVVELVLAGVFGIPFGGLAAVFAQSLVVPTALGRERLAAIDGLGLYLAVAEADRLEVLHPPARTAEHFEELLPYAIALGHARSWTRQFAHALGTTRPEWYDAPAGRDEVWDWLEDDRLEDHLHQTTKRPARVNQGGGGGDDGGSVGWSSPGSGGGGSSGGGGGGGSTRGW